MGRTLGTSAALQLIWKPHNPSEEWNSEDEERTLRGYGFSLKRVIFIANVDESGLAEDSPPAAALRSRQQHRGRMVELQDW